MLRYYNKDESQIEEDKYKKLKGVIESACSEICEVKKVTDYIEHRKIEEEWLHIMIHAEEGVEEKVNWCQEALGIILKNVRWELDGSNRMDEEEMRQFACNHFINRMQEIGMFYDYKQQINLNMNNILLKNFGGLDEMGYMQCAILMDAYNYMRAKTFSDRSKDISIRADASLLKGNRLYSNCTDDSIHFERVAGKKVGLLVMKHEINSKMQALIILDKKVRQFFSGDLAQQKNMKQLKAYFLSYV